MLDRTDAKILNELQRNSRATVRELAKKIAVPITTVHSRLKRLQRDGTIKRFTIELNHEKLGKSILAFVFAEINHEILVDKQHDRNSLRKKLLGFDEVEHIYAVTGNMDVIIQVRVGAVKELNELIIKKFRNIPGIGKTSTVIVLEED